LLEKFVKYPVPVTIMGDWHWIFIFLMEICLGFF
jgi:hypothetical protein